MFNKIFIMFPKDYMFSQIPVILSVLFKNILESFILKAGEMTCGL